MIGRMFGLSFCVAGVVGLAATGAYAAGPAKGDLILPKSDKMRLEESPGESTAFVSVDQIKIDWPAKVKDVNGQWLQINDEGGYTLPGKTAATGWVRKNDVITMDGALTNFSSLISSNEVGLAGAGAKTATDTKKRLARLYWLRGIYWETNAPQGGGDQPQIALVDFQAATCVDPELADAWLRQGRMLAKIFPIDKQTGPKGWLACFKNASDHFQCVNASKKAATVKAGDSTTCTSDAASRTCPATGCERVPRPPARTFAGIGFLKLSPPQLYLDLGLAYQSLWDAAIAGDAKIAAAKDPVNFDAASVCFQWAECSNPYWFRPASAQGDLYSARVNKGLDPDFGGRPKNELSADDLFAAVDWYSKSIRLNNQFDEALRGRADALRLLAISPKLTPPKTPPADPRFRDLFFPNQPLEMYLAKAKAQAAVLDAAYESANAASMLTNDRSAKSLETRGYVEIAFTYQVSADISPEYMAQAAETLKEAAQYSRSTTEKDNLHSLILNTNTQSFWVLANVAAQDDIQFVSIWNRAGELRHCVDRLWENVKSLNSKDLEKYQPLVEAVASAQRAIGEMNEIQPFGHPKRPAAGAAEKANVKNKTGYGAQTWPNAPTLSELIDRNGRISAWALILKELEGQVYANSTDQSCPLQKELNDCSDELRKSLPTRT